MIGLVASLLAGIVLGKWVFAFSIVPALLRLRSRDLALVAFYLYVLALIPFLNGVSLLSRQGVVFALSATLPAFLLLDDVLRGVKFGPEEVLLSVALTVSALHDYTFALVLLGVVIYSSFRRFGRVSFYLASWFGLLAVTFYLLRGSLHGLASQAFLIIGLGLVPLLIAERKEVDFAER